MHGSNNRNIKLAVWVSAGSKLCWPANRWREINGLSKTSKPPQINNTIWADLTGCA